MEGRKIYTSSGETLFESDIKNLPFIGKGMFGSVYDYGDGKVIKIMDEPSILCSYQGIAAVKRLKLSNYYRLYEILSEKPSSKIYIGSIGSYHRKENINIWEMPSEWLIENYEKLYEDVSKLGRSKIAIYDTLPCNCIINSDGITVIDVDRYIKSKYECVESNVRRLHRELFRPLLRCNYAEFHPNFSYDYEFERVLDELLQNFPQKKELAKILSKYPKPIDFLKDRINE